MTDSSFTSVALDVFRFQAAHNALYASYLELLEIDPAQVSDLASIPCLPIQFFKKYAIQTGRWEPERVFSSSGTTGQTPSRHLVRDLSWYYENTLRGFERTYGRLENICVLALLPSYLERSGSSLVSMADHFIRRSRHAQSGFFLYNKKELLRMLEECKKKETPVLLLGVSFALLDLAETYPRDLQGVIVMETGGMKGRREELTREALHRILKEAFHLESIHSEYGMTELLSQAYSPGEGRFFPAPTLRVFAREVTDPFTRQGPGRTGVLDLIDLANLDTISFIATDDLGKVYRDHSFEVLGRLDASDIRGCNLMVE